MLNPSDSYRIITSNDVPLMMKVISIW